MTGRRIIPLFVASAPFVLVLCHLVGCSGRSKPLPPPQDMGSSEPGIYNLAATFQFRDSVESNRQDDGTVGDLEFVDTAGQTVRLDQYKDNKNLLLVFTRGFAGELCPFCTTQTSRLIANYDQFTNRDTEVLLVYPGSKEQLPQFQQASIRQSGKDGFPFPVLLDEELSAVKRLGIEAQLAFPSTFIIDKQGQVRLSYVGADPTDRPSIKALISKLDALQ